MSEYQYYEFQTVDHRLTAKEQAAISQLSSRVQLTPTRAIFLYNYGDFRHNPKQVLTKYFDVMFYIANWGTWQLIFRLPKGIVDPQWFQPYALDHCITVTQTSEYIILDLEINEEEGMSGWVEGEGWLSRLLPLRDELLQGDLRLLYLAWLRVAPTQTGYELEDDPVEPPIPPNLGKLSPALNTFVELVEMDPDFVAAAAQKSPLHQAISHPPLEEWLSNLSETERQEFLLKLVRREPNVDLQLINRLQALAGAERARPQATSGQRRLSELDELAQTVREKRIQKEKNAARKKRIKTLEALAPKEDHLWERVVELITLKQSRAYDEAVALLQDLGA